MNDFDEMAQLADSYSRMAEKSALERSARGRKLPVDGNVKEYNLDDLLQFFFVSATAMAFTRVDWKGAYIQLNNQRGYPFIQLVEKNAARPLQSLDMELQPYWGWVRYRRTFVEWLRGRRARRNTFDALKGTKS